MATETFLRNTTTIVTADELTDLLTSGKQLRVKFGIDPTNADLHLGHTVPLRLLRAFQRLGHLPVIIIGSATAWIGDPSERDSTRTQLTWDQIEQNHHKYLAHIAKFVNLRQAEVHDNFSWFGQLTFTDMMELLRSATVQQILQREDFAARIIAAKPINLVELVYPLLQAQDSVEVKADVEIGGTEQLFNLMMGRELQKAARQKPQVCITLPLLIGTDGKQKMGKSLNNYIAVDEQPFTMFSKVMSIPDSLLESWFRLLTDLTTTDINQIGGDTPFLQKITLACQLVAEAHGEVAAAKARTEWVKRFSNRADPDNPEEIRLSPGRIGIIQLLRILKFADSKNAARRLMQPTSCVSVGPDRQKITDVNTQIEVVDGLMVRAGNRRIVRVRCIQGNSDANSDNPRAVSSDPAKRI